VVDTLAVVIPAFGRNDLTQAVIRDLRSDGGAFNLYVVDNRGDFIADRLDTIVLRPGSNLGWAGGCNLGLREAFSAGHDSVMLLNNDTRLSPGFVRGMQDASLTTQWGVLGPLYDHNWPQQVAGYLGSAQNYQPKIFEVRVPFIDGTCMMISHAVFEQVGVLDDSNWPRFGWGCDKDYCLRVRVAGGAIWVTERSYLNHLARRTAAALPGFSEIDAELENDCGMEQKWGKCWRDLLYEGFDHVPRAGPATSS
jgi:GT2 family glycosyltransferase